jgi:hypothetical protein
MNATVALISELDCKKTLFESLGFEYIKQLPINFINNVNLPTISKTKWL